MTTEQRPSNTLGRCGRCRYGVSTRLRAAEAVAAVEALVAGAVADGDVPADLAEGGVAHHLRQLLAQAAIVGQQRRYRDVLLGQRLGRLVAVAVPVTVPVVLPIAVAVDRVRTRRGGGP